VVFHRQARWSCPARPLAPAHLHRLLHWLCRRGNVLQSPRQQGQAVVHGPGRRLVDPDCSSHRACRCACLGRSCGWRLGEGVTGRHRYPLTLPVSAGHIGQGTAPTRCAADSPISGLLG
jgi:hypothetical protein